jgi:hypothetical protein
MPITCANGTRPKAGSPEWFFFDRASGVTFLTQIGSWLTNAMMGLDDAPQKTSDFCSRPPTGDLPTNGDILALSNPPLALISGAYTRFGNYVRESTFAQYCECSPPTGPGCTSRELVVRWSPLGPSISACGPTSWYLDGPSPETTFPAGQHRVRIQSMFPAAQDIQVDVYEAGVGVEVCQPWLAGTLLDRTYIATTSVAAFNMAFRMGGLEPTWLLGRTLNLSFSDAPGETPCAPVGTPIAPPPAIVPPTGFVPSPTLACTTLGEVCAALSAISRDIGSIILNTETLQQWQLPFSSVDGAEHAGLEGGGSFPINRLLGVRVYVTQSDADKPVLPGNPPYLWDLGWISINNADGMIEEKRVTRSGYTWLPHAMQLATSFNWALTDGTVLTVIEVKPEAV